MFPAIGVLTILGAVCLGALPAGGTACGWSACRRLLRGQRPRARPVPALGGRRPAWPADRPRRPRIEAQGIPALPVLAVLGAVLAGLLTVQAVVLWRLAPPRTGFMILPAMARRHSPAASPPAVAAQSRPLRRRTPAPPPWQGRPPRRPPPPVCPGRGGLGGARRSRVATGPSVEAPQSWRSLGAVLAPAGVEDAVGVRAAGRCGRRRSRAAPGAGWPGRSRAGSRRSRPATRRTQARGRPAPRWPPPRRQAASASATASRK